MIFSIFLVVHLFLARFMDSVGTIKLLTIKNTYIKLHFNPDIDYIDTQL